MIRILVSYGNCTGSGKSYSDAAVFQDLNDMDLDMLAPYISMDEDFQLTILPQLPETETQSVKVSSTCSKKRYCYRIVMYGLIRKPLIDFVTL